MNNDEFDPCDNEEEELISRSQIKREMQELQDLGESLVEMSKKQLAHVPLPASLSAAIVEARRLKSREAKRRQIQFIGKLMRDIDMAPIDAAMEKIRTQGQRHQLQREQSIGWAERMISEGPGAVEEFLQQYWAGDRQQLRQLQRSAAKEAEQRRQQQQAGQKQSPASGAGKLQQALLEAMELSA
ncbi:MAG: DUF615 domain-containing protein [Cellvibrionaceae bacterium]|nr:DUF615 domain-containing protein [Cellvibrionaceae bacterium]